MTNKINFKILSRIIFGLFFFLFLNTQNSFAIDGYQCITTPIGKKFYQIGSDGKLGFSSFFAYSNIDKNQTNCPDSKGNFGSSCKFSGTGGIIGFKLKDNPSELSNGKGCPYKPITLTSNSFSYTGKTEFEIKTTINSGPTSNEAIITAMEDMIYTENPLIYFDNSEMFFFGGKDQNLNNDGNTTYSDFEGSFYKNSAGSYVYRYNSGDLNLKKDFTKEKKYRIGSLGSIDDLGTNIENDKIRRNSGIIQKIGDGKFLIIGGKDYQGNYKNDVRIFYANKTGPTAEGNGNPGDKGMWEELRIHKYDLNGNDVSGGKNLSQFSPACAWNKDEAGGMCIDLEELKKEKTEKGKHCNNPPKGCASEGLEKSEYGPYSDSTTNMGTCENSWDVKYSCNCSAPDENGIGGGCDTCSRTETCSIPLEQSYNITKYKAEKLCNDKVNNISGRGSWGENASSCRRKTQEEINLTELSVLNNKNIIGGSYHDNKLYLILQGNTESTFGDIQIQEINFNTVTNGASRNTLGASRNILINNDFKHNFGQAINCKNGNCILAIAGGSKKEDIFVNGNCGKNGSRKLNDNFSKQIQIIKFGNLSGSETINLDENIFGTGGIINPKVLIDENLNIFITSFETKKALTNEQASRTNLDTCNYTTCGAGDYLRKEENNFIGKYNYGNSNPVWEKYSIKSNNINQNLLGLGVSKGEQSDFLKGLTKTSQNNIFQYPLGKSYIFEEGKQIVNCTVNTNGSEIFFYKECKRKHHKTKCGSAYMYGKSFLPIELRSGFWKWGDKGRNPDEKSNYDTGSILKLSPIQSLKNNNEISFGGTFGLSNDITYLNTIIKEEGENYCKNENCSSTGEFIGFTKDFIDNYLKIENRRNFSVLGKAGNPPTFYNGDRPIGHLQGVGEAFNGSSVGGNRRWKPSGTKYIGRKHPSLKISFSTGSNLIDSKSGLDFATLISDNFNPIANNGKVQTGSFLFSKKFSPGYHKVHLMFITQPGTKRKANVQMESGNDLKTRSEVVIDFAKGSGIGNAKFSPKGSGYNCYGKCSGSKNAPNAFGYKTNDWNTELDNYRLQYQAFVYEFYIPEVTNIKNGEIGGTKPTFTGKYTPKDSQLFFYSGSGRTMRLNDIPKNYPVVSTGFTLTGATTFTKNNFNQTSNSEIKNIVQLVDNSELHHKIRPSVNTGTSVGEFKYSPILGFEKNKNNYLKYFYIDSKGNIIGGESEKFKVGTGSNLSFYNRIDENGSLITDSIKPFISGNYEKNKEMDINFLGEGKVKIKSNEKGNFNFQLNKKLQEGKKYFLNFNGITPNQKLKISSEKLIPEIISHKSGDIEASKRPIFFGNGKAGENIKIEVYTENQKNLNEKFSEIKCKNILSSTGYNADLNGGNSFSQTKIYSCSELGEFGTKTILSQTGITVNDNGNWSWQLDKNLKETNNFDSKNIYFVKVYYNGESEKNYDLISFRYLPKKEFTKSFAGAFKGTGTGNFLETEGDNNLKISLNSGTGSEIEIFENSGTGTIKISSGLNTNLDFSIKIPVYSGIKFGTGITTSSTGIFIEKGMRIYKKESGKIFLNQEEKFLQLKKGDKIFSGAKESEIKFSKNLEIFSYGKIKIFPNSGKIFVEFNKNLDFFVNDFDKINLGFFEKIKNYFNGNSGTGKKYSNNPFSGSSENLLKEYKNNIQTILNFDKNSSNKNFRISDSFNGKLVRVGEKFLIKGTAWPETLLKISIDDKTVGSVYSDKDGTFTFYIPKYLEYKIGIFTTNLHKIRIDNNEQKNLSEEFYFSMNDNFSGSYLQDFNISNSERNFREKKGFINFSEKNKKIPEFFK